MLASRAGRLAVAAMPAARVLPESDGPFSQVASTPVMPWDSWSVVPSLSELWDGEAGEVGQQLMQNFRDLVGQQL